MEFRRIPSLPPYVFAEIDRLKLELRRAGEDVIDLGFGNPDLPSPEVAVEKLREAAENPRNHRYSASRGIPNLRRAICDRYASRYGVELDPETEAIATMGAKEGFCHLFWVLVEPGRRGARARRRATRSTCSRPSSPARRSSASPWRPPPTSSRRSSRRTSTRSRKPRVARPLVPAQPDDRGRRPDFMQARRRLRAGARRAARARLRVRRPRLRRALPAVDPAGRGREGRRGRALLPDEGVLARRLARRVRRRERGGRRTRSAA